MSAPAPTATDGTRSPQPGILDQRTTCHWIQQYTVSFAADVAALRRALADIRAIEGGENGARRVVLAMGSSLLGTLATAEMPAGARPFTDIEGPEVEGARRTAPATQDDLLVWFASDTPDRNLAAAWRARAALDGLAELREETPGFQYFESLDLTGFEDGTENPKGDERLDVAVLAEGPGAGGSFVLAQRWVHDLARFEHLDVADQERVIGRTKDGSVELDPLPEHSHVERVVMEDGAGEEREIFRRSFPYGDTSELGLFFLAFAADPTVLSDMLHRMFGLTDGHYDHLTGISRPVSGAYYVAPAVEVLDAALG
ncbi:MAG: Dyp-type peroxidase [Microthrixaceae bacterium]